ETIAQSPVPGFLRKRFPIDPKANEFVFGDTARPGVYRVRLGTNDLVFCVDLLDAAESNIQPHDELQLGEHNKVAATTMQRTNLELWRTIAAIGLLVLLGEWWYYHRRTV